VPVEVRRFIGAVARRMHRMQDTRAVSDDIGGMTLLISDLMDALRISTSTVKKRLAQMESYGLGDYDEIGSDLGPQPGIRVWNPEHGPRWCDIVAFCEKTSTPLESFTDNLNFSQLDS
jgi:hypothetical protein